MPSPLLSPEPGPSALTDALERSPGLAGAGDLVREMATTVAREIIEGNLPAGHRLTSVELGNRFGTSRTPVREALTVLAQEGLVDIQPRRRPQVASLSRDDLRDLYEIRGSLYALIATTVVQRGDPAELLALDAPLAVMQEAARSGDRLAYFYGTVRFRQTEADICPNRSVGPLIDSLGLRIFRLRRFGLSLPGRMEVSVRDYVRLVEAYREGDAALAVAITRSLMAKAADAIAASWDLLENPAK